MLLLGTRSWASMGAYVRDRHPWPARSFEVVGQVRSAGATPTRFAFVRQGSTAGAAPNRRMIVQADATCRRAGRAVASSP
jgi:hypothetical protein